MSSSKLLGRLLKSGSRGFQECIVDTLRVLNNLTVLLCCFKLPQECSKNGQRSDKLYLYDR